MAKTNGTITLSELRYIYWLDMWHLIATSKILDFKTEKELDDFEYCRHMGELLFWGWCTQKYHLINLSKEDCWWTAFLYFWKDLGRELE